MARRRNPLARNRGGSRTPTFLSRSVLCRLSGISERQLSVWEHEELIVPARKIEFGRRREPLYATETLGRIRIIRTLAEDLDVNLPGIEVILNLLERLSA